MVRSLVHTLGEGALRLLYPSVCLGCGEALPEAVTPLCPLCIGDLERVDRDELRAFLARDGVVPDAHALWRFDRGGTFQAIHHGLKYEGRSHYGRLLGRWVGEGLGASLRGTLVPIPLHRRRYLERGYNQSALIAEGIAAVTGQPLGLDWLTRRVATGTQTRLGRVRRRTNVEQAFVVTPGVEVEGRDVTLVDDVVTTGATLQAAADILRAAGARHVQLVAVAWAR